MNKEKENETPVVFDFKNFNFSRLEYAHPAKTRGSAHASSIYYRVNRNTLVPVFIRTPKMKTSSGICRSSNRYHIEFDLDANNQHSEFYDFLAKSDENNKKITYQNSGEWFDGPFPMDIIDDYYQGTIRLNSGGKSPTLKVRIPSKGDIIVPQIYNNGSIVDHSYVSPDDSVQAVIVLDELKFYEQKFHAEWLLVQLKVYKKKLRSVEIPNAYLLQGDEDETETEKNQESDDEVEQKPLSQPAEKLQEVQETKADTPVEEVKEEHQESKESERLAEDLKAEGSSETKPSLELKVEETTPEMNEESQSKPEKEESAPENKVDDAENKVIEEDPQPTQNLEETVGKDSKEEVVEQQAEQAQAEAQQAEAQQANAQQAVEESANNKEEPESPPETENKPKSGNQKYYVLDPVWNSQLTVDDMEEVPIFGSNKKKVDPTIIEKFTNNQKLLDEALQGWEKAKSDALEKEEQLKNLRENYLQLKQELGLES